LENLLKTSGKAPENLRKTFGKPPENLWNNVGIKFDSFDSN
jgi:hypothetical protein